MRNVVLMNSFDKTCRLVKLMWLRVTQQYCTFLWIISEDTTENKYVTSSFNNVWWLERHYKLIKTVCITKNQRYLIDCVSRYVSIRNFAPFKSSSFKKIKSLEAMNSSGYDLENGVQGKTTQNCKIFFWSNTHRRMCCVLYCAS